MTRCFPAAAPMDTFTYECIGLLLLCGHSWPSAPPPTPNPLQPNPEVFRWKKLVQGCWLQHVLEASRMGYSPFVRMLHFL
mmetsp:Transcript_4785/g.12092  ORF Transcript_4785/g.12092 Transcript_4785/m.12092 type:complete len:80 (+) Transcript_4785:241-480(+)